MKLVLPFYTTSKVSQKEISQVANDRSILTGIEYEIIMDEGELGDSAQAEAYRQAEEAGQAYRDFEQELLEWVYDAIDKKNEWYEKIKELATRELANIDEYADSFGQDLFPETFEDIQEVLDEAKEELQALVDSEDRDEMQNNDMYDFGYPNEYKALVKKLMGPVDVDAHGVSETNSRFLLIDFIADNSEEYIQEEATSFPNSAQAYDDLVGTSIEGQIDEDKAARMVAESETLAAGDPRVIADSLMEDVDRPMDPDEYTMDMYYDGGSDDSLEGRDWSDFPFGGDYVTGEYHSGPTRSDTWRIETDESLGERGAELISPTEPLPDTLDMMDEMFEHIPTVASTTSETGLHVNMSIEGRSFDDMDPVKLALFMDEGYVYKFFRDREGNTYTKSLDEWVRKALKGVDTTDTRKLRKVLLDKFPFEKMTGINLSNIEAVDGTARAEFRYLGGEGYERKRDYVRLQILKYAAYMKIAFDPEYRKREYLQKLIRLRNKFGDAGEDIRDVGTLVKETDKFWIYDVKGKKIRVPRVPARQRPSHIPAARGY